MTESLLEFPCSFPIKIMGRTQDGFAQTVLDIVLRHVPDYDSGTMEMRASREGNYLSLTCVVTPRPSNSSTSFTESSRAIRKLSWSSRPGPGMPDAGLAASPVPA